MILGANIKVPVFGVVPRLAFLSFLTNNYPPADRRNPATLILSISSIAMSRKLPLKYLGPKWPYCVDSCKQRVCLYCCAYGFIASLFESLTVFPTCNLGPLHYRLHITKPDKSQCFLRRTPSPPKAPVPAVSSTPPKP